MSTVIPAFDPGPLGWVKPEIDLALERAGEAIARLAVNPGDLTRAQTAQTHLHQVSGALALVGLEPLAHVAEAVEKLLGALASGQIRLDAPQAAAARRMLQDLGDYLSGLMSGAPHQPMRLYPAYRELAAAAGLESPSEVDLFYPDLSLSPPGGSPPLPPAESAALIGQRRGEYQRGLLNLLRNQQAGASLAAMRDALLAIEAVQPPERRTFWWIAAALLDGLAASEAPPAGALRQLLSRLDLQMKRQAETGEAAPERLARELLYALARMPADTSPRVAEAHALFGLEALLAGADGEVGAAGRLSQTLRELSARLETLKEHWTQAAGGQPASLERFAELAGELADAAGGLRRPSLYALCGAIAEVAAALRAQDRTPEDALALETATALLVLGEGLGHYHRLGADFDRQAEAAAARLRAALAGEPPPEESRGLVEEIARAAEEARLNAQVGQEIRASLAQAEALLDGFFRDPSRRESLAGLSHPLAQVEGAFAMLDSASAAGLVRALHDQVERFAASEAAAPANAELVAEALGVLGQYAEAIRSGKAEAEPALEAELVRLSQAVGTRAAALAEETAPAAGFAPPPEPTLAPAAEPAPQAGVEDLDAELLEVFLEEAGEVLDTIGAQADVLRAAPAEKEALTVIRRGFHTLKGSGRMVGLDELGEAAWQVEQVLNKWLRDGDPASARLLQLIAEARAAFGQWIATLRQGYKPVVEAAAIAALAEELKSEPAEAAAPAPIAVQASEPAPRAPVVIGEVTLDADFFQVFAREATQHCGTLTSGLQRLRADPSTAPSEDLTRAVHTLAGIAGTCGFAPLADLGVALERWLQDRIDRPATLTADELALVGEAVEQMGQMVKWLLALTPPAPQPELIAALQESLERPPALAAEPEPEAAPALPAFTLPSLDLSVPASVPGLEEVAAPAPAAVEVGKERRLLSDDLDEQLLPLFLDEAFDLVPEVGELLRGWRADPANRQFAVPLGRHLHTLKGSARMAGVMRLGELAHRLETQVAALKASEGADPAGLDLLEDGFDRFTAALERLRTGEPAPAAAPAVLPAVPLAPPKPLPVVTAQERERGSVLRVRADLVDRFVNDAGELSIARSRIEGELNAFRQGLAELTGNVAKLRAQLREIEIQAESQIQSSIQLQQGAGGAFDPLEFDRFTRMQELTRFMAESVNDFVTLQQSLQGNIDEIDAALTAQSRLNRGLQEDLMDVRMVPLANLSDRFYRIVRQTAKELGKRANLELSGMRTELDRGVLEKVIAPFEHLLRNAVAHGIEFPEVREARGKPPIGEIVIDARQQANEVVLTLSDDGGGVDLARIREKALAAGLMRADEALADAQLTQFIFVPGFSTATELTEVAGRGIGMDVVRNEILGLGGRVQVESTPGRGTTFIVSLPLTLAVTHAVLFSAGQRRYAVPSVMVEQVQRHKQAAIQELRARGEVFWQGNRYPLHSLAALLGEEESEAEPRRYFPVLLVKSGAQRVAVEVDDIVGNREVVVKPIGPQLSRLAGIAGATVLGNGEIVLILNPALLATRGEALPAPRPAMAAQPAAAEARAPLVMVVDDSLTVRKITSRLLTREGYRVVTAKDGVDALKQLQEIYPDALLLDIEMPRMDGFELTRNLRADPRTATIPIIMITSRTAEKHRSFAFELGVNEYLGKPFQEEELLGHLARFTGREAVH